ncbi:MAG: NAD(P)/FAD-dependent oxidoreductase [Armatimonadota bacterium]|nr:NAD(P)/FAD-dependent oxidoreductase [Armatimonadota bacterium]MDR7533806.1 NAD(P)/FAD-dependent oxidoreductase [Armatimonadota bacterium]MDR7536665.1 NAD(P)/FAD-dependent oxidoreductase [Armatimonadota bacterium]
MRCDVLVVGAGPGGSTAARAAALLGLRVVLLEEHPRVGCPTHCTGKLSVHAFRRFDLPASLVQTALRAAVLCAPDGTTARVRRATVDSYVVDRDPFDRFLAGRAAAAGVEVITGARARAVHRDRGRLRVVADRRSGRLTVDAAVVIDAEGANPVLPAQLGLRPRRRLVHGLQYEVEGVRIDADDTPELYFGRDVAPGFFGWLMPIGGDRGRLGVAVDPRLTARPPVYFLERLKAAHPVVASRLRGARIVRRLAGRIPVLGPRRPSYAPGMLVVGDAAGHVKATSGGGIYFAMLAGDLAAGAAARLVGGAASARALAEYERAWQAAFGREVRFTSVVRRILNRLPDRHLSAVIRALASDAGLRRAVEEHGDTQYQSRLLRPVVGAALRAGIRDPRITPAVLAALGAAALSLWDDGADGGARTGQELLQVAENLPETH